MGERAQTIAAHEWLDSLRTDEARATLLRCCGSLRWVSAMLSLRPYGSADALRNAARSIWAGLGRDDYLEAFAHHPPIGGNLDALRAKFAPTLAWSSHEQAGVAEASDAILLELRDANRLYRERHGYVFIICATGKTAGQMLDALRARLGNDPALELALAAAEHAQITELRLEKVGP